MATEQSATDVKIMKNCKQFAISFAAIIIVMVLSAGFSNAQNQNNANPGSSQPGAPSNHVPPAEAASKQVLEATKLIGYTVENQTGAKLGKVTDLAIDTRSGRLDFIMIAAGGFAGVGAKLKAVPPGALSPATAKEKTLAMDISADRWKTAPNFSKDQLANVGNQMQMRMIYRFYGQAWPAPAQAAETKAPMSPTGRESGNAGRLKMASDLMDKSAVNQQGQDVGRITDLLVNLKNPQTTFALLKPGSYITSANEAAKNEQFAVPIYAFIPSATSNKLVLDLDAGVFSQARPLNAESWKTARPGAGPPRIFLYQPDQNESAKISPPIIINSWNHYGKITIVGKSVFDGGQGPV